MEVVIIFWVIGSMVAAGALAHSKGRSVVGWVLLALVLGWLAVIILACIGDVKALEEAVAKARHEAGEHEHRRRLAELAAAKAAAAVDATKKCPMCAETIKAEAVVCRFCGHKFGEAHPAIRAAQPPVEPPPAGPDVRAGRPHSQDG